MKKMMIICRKSHKTYAQRRVYLRVNSRNRALQDDKQGSEPIRSACKKGWSGTGGWMDYRLWTGPRRSRSSLEIKECLRQRRKQS